MNFNFKKSHLSFNMLSFGINALSGLVLNILIVRFYDLSILGLFNQCLALYFILSQVSTFGIHFSTLSNIPLEDKKSQVFISALLLTLFISIFFNTTFYFSLRYLLNLFQFFLLSESLVFLIPAVILFSLSKVIIFSLNGLGLFHRFAFANGLRLFIMLVGLLIHYTWKLRPESIATIILFSETILLLVLFSMTTFLFKFKENLNLRFWIKKHFLYGKSAILSGLIIDLNMKVDILVLSFFVTKPEIGIYSFAAMLGEGFYQFISIFKNLNSRNLSLYLHTTKNLKKIYSLKEFKKLSMLFYFTGILSIILFKPFTQTVTNNNMITDKGFWVYLIYAGFLLIASKYIVLDNFILLLGKPEIDNKIRIKILLTNFVFCIVLSKFFGIYGAVTALGVSILYNAYAIKLQINKHYQQSFL